MFRIIQPSMLFCTFAFFWDQFSLNNFSDCFIDNITKLIRSNKSTWELLESRIIHFFLGLISIVLNLFILNFDSNTLINKRLELFFRIKSKFTKRMLPRSISVSKGKIFHNIFKVIDGIFTLHSILVQRIIQRILKPTRSFFKIGNNFIVQFSLNNNLRSFSIQSLRNLIFITDTFSWNLNWLLIRRFDFVDKHTKILIKKYSHKGGTKLYAFR